MKRRSEVSKLCRAEILALVAMVVFEQYSGMLLVNLVGASRRGDIYVREGKARA